MTHREVGWRIRQARMELNLSQGDLGRLLSRQRTHAAVSDIERGKTKLDVELISELAMLLRKDVAYFYTEPTPERTPHDRLEEIEARLTELEDCINVRIVRVNQGPACHGLE